LAHRIVFGTTILMMAAATLGLVSELAQIDLAAFLYGAFTVIWASWVLIVGLGYLHGYRLLIRATDQRSRRAN
jgi:predicted membrane-bound spermidine synthase